MGTQWSRLDRGLLFGRMYEDPAVELAAFPRGGQVFCIASAGCTALALSARGDTVTAVDLNPTQIDYVRARLATGAVRRGRVDLAYAAGRRLLPLTGLTPRVLRAFLELDDPMHQARLWRDRIDAPLFRLLLDVALSRSVLRLTPVRRFVDVLPPRFGAVIRERFERGVSRHPNSTNHFIWRQLLGQLPPGFHDPSPIGAIKLVHAEALAYLERQPVSTFDGFSLSNICDGADEKFRSRLLAAMRQCARPGARYVLRSFSAAQSEAEARNASTDRSHLWGRIVIGSADA